MMLDIGCLWLLAGWILLIVTNNTQTITSLLATNHLAIGQVNISMSTKLADWVIQHRCQSTG